MVKLVIFEEEKFYDACKKESMFRDIIINTAFSIEEDYYCIRTITPGYNNYYVEEIDEDIINVARSNYEELVEFANNFKNSKYKFKLYENNDAPNDKYYDSNNDEKNSTNDNYDN